MEYYKEVFIKSDFGPVDRKCLPVSEIEEFFAKLKPCWKGKNIGLMTYVDQDKKILADFDYWVDIDADDKKNRSSLQNLEITQTNCAALLAYMCTAFSMAPEDVSVYFSGNGGFHLLLPFHLKHYLDWKELVYRVRRTANELVTVLGKSWQPGSHVDLPFYKNRCMIRLPWSEHESGLRKVEIQPPELMLPAIELMKVIENRTLACTGGFGLQWWREKKSNIEFEDYVCRPSHFLTPVNPPTASPAIHIDEFIDEVAKDAPCVPEIMRFRMKLKPQVRFNQQKMFLLSQMKRMKRPFDYSLAVMKAWADAYSEHVRSTSSHDIMRRRDEVYRAAVTIFFNSANPTYDFEIKGQCVRKLNCIVLDDSSKPCVSKKCKHWCNITRQESTRISLAKLLKSTGNPTDLYVYTHLALHGPEHGFSDFAKTLRMSRNTIRSSTKRLERLGLVSIDKSNGGLEIKATYSLRKSFVVKI